MKLLRNTLAGLFAASALLSSAATPHALSSQNATLAQDFNSMWDAAAQTPSLTLPEGWLVERNLTAPRTIGKWADASSELMYSGGVSLASNAKNGTWNFGASENPADRAIGGLTTTVNNGTRGVSLMTALTNADERAIDRFAISYNIEKYRKGANAAGFQVQLYTSVDGETWIPAGDSFKTLFTPDTETIGAEIVPIETVEVDKVLMADVAPGETLYLAWNISVATGATPDKAPGLAIDDITVSASFANPDAKYIYVENATGLTPLSVYAVGSDAFGEKPGATSELSKTLNGVTYTAWEMPELAELSLGVCAGASEFGPIAVNTAADAYICASPLGLEVIENPESYTGWVDPSRPPFVASGIYIRGEVNSWGAPADWEFSREDDNTYVLYDKTLNGQFKVADSNWSSSCNYGSNGSNISADVPYALSAGVDANISCGNFVFECKRIVLTIANGQATLLLESNDDATGLTTVYMVGDFNSWNYMDTTGALTLDESDNLFKGQVSMKGAADGLSHWRIYQRLGMSGAWGLEADAEQASLSGKLLKGETGNAAVAPATYKVTFSLADGAYTFEEIEAAPAVMTLNPADVVLTPANPEAIKVLSLNNSLIHYNDQDFVFNDIASAMGVNAAWTKHTNLGKPLSYHWNEGDGLAEDGTPGAKMMIRSEAWSHIILQEQSALPRTNPETFRNSVAQWIEYIREYCPNPNAVIILPVNWAYSSDWTNFSDYNALFLSVYADIASELGAVVCPVAAAYDAVYKNEGAEAAGTWFSDDRHPTLKATYMAACMEYAVITGAKATDITFVPEGMEAEEAASMRTYAENAVKSFANAVDHLNGKVQFSARIFDDFGIELPVKNVVYTVDGGGNITPEGLFTSDGTKGTFTVKAEADGFSKTAKITVADHETVVITFPAICINEDKLSASENFDAIGTEAEATLPEAWRIDRTGTTRSVGTFATAQTKTAYAGGTSLPSNAKNGLWNFGADGSSDRAVGGITTGVANGTRAVNVYTHIKNDGKKKVQNIVLSYDIEKYRKGNNPAGFAVELFYSFDGRNWKAAGEDFKTVLEPDDATEGYETVPGEVHSVSAVLPFELGAGLDVYLAWNISVASGDAAQGAMALGIDNVSLAGELPPVPVTNHRIYVDNQTTWNAVGLYAWGDSELFGAWPGQAPIDENEVDGVKYLVFGLDSDGGSFNLIFNNWNNNKQLPDFNITANRDYWFRITDEKVEEIVASGVENVASSEATLALLGNTLVSDSEGTLTVCNLQGIALLSAFGTELSLAGLPSGIYIASNGSATIKIAL